MIKKIIIIIMVVTLIISIFCCIAIQASSDRIEKSDILEYINSDNKKANILKNDILSKILKDMGENTDEYNLSEIKLKAIFGNVIDKNKEDILFALRFDSKNSTVIVYSQTNKGYEFTYKIDDFFDVVDLQVIDLKDENKKIVVVKEHINQLLGAFEEGTYIRGYTFNKDKFDLVLNISEEYKAYWNELWDSDSNKDENHWLKVYEKSDIFWENKEASTIKVLKNQYYFLSKQVNIKYLPSDKDFTVIKDSKVLREYKWSSKWNSFILCEALIKDTDEGVAVLETSEDSPFYITGISKENKCRIKRKNGTIEIIDTDKLDFLK